MFYKYNCRCDRYKSKMFTEILVTDKWIKAPTNRRNRGVTEGVDREELYVLRICTIHLILTQVPSFYSELESSLFKSFLGIFKYFL